MCATIKNESEQIIKRPKSTIANEISIEVLNGGQGPRGGGG